MKNIVRVLKIKIKAFADNFANDNISSSMVCWKIIQIAGNTSHINFEINNK